mgnify:CR=1 FL=1
MPEWVVVLLVCAGGYGVVVILNLLSAFQIAVAIPDPSQPATRGWRLYALLLATPAVVAAWIWSVARRGFWYQFATYLGFAALCLVALPIHELLALLGNPAGAKAIASLWLTLLVSIPLAGVIRPYVQSP